MAQVTGAVTGLTVTATAAGEVDDDEQVTVEEELCHRTITRLRQHQPKAALAAAVDLVNRIAHEHGLSGGAYL